MSELGSGSGSSYPTALDTDNSLEYNSPNANKTKARAECINDANAAILAVETTLGTNPQGGLADVKTFLQTQHTSGGAHTGVTTNTVVATSTVSATQYTSTIATGTAPLVVSSTTVVANLHADVSDKISDGTNTLRLKVINIGDWNMDTTASVSIAHGLTLANIRQVQAIIRNDLNTAYFQLTPEGTAYGGTSEIAGKVAGIDATNVNLARFTTGAFDSTSFDSLSWNRGYITIWYVV